MHDPKLKAQKEVTGTVRLKLMTLKGQPFWVTRIARIKLLGGDKTKFESAESKMEMGMEDGRRQTVASKSQAVTQHVADILGVSTAVLEYVIFCHQEESNWPLNEAKLVKSRFDEIFAVERYTKAIDEMRSARKGFVAEVRTLEERLKIITMRKEQRAAIMREIDEKQNKLVELQAMVQRDDDVLAKLDSEKKHYQATLKQLKSTFDALKTLQTKEATYRQQIDRFGQSQNEFSDLSLEELKSRKKNFSSHSSEDLKSKAKLEKAAAQLKAQTAQIEERRLSLTQSFASLSELSRMLPDLVQSRLDMAVSFVLGVPKVFQNSKFDGASILTMEADSALFTELVQVAETVSSKMKNALLKAKSDHETAVNQAMKSVEDQTHALANVRGTESSLTQQIKQLSLKLQELTDEIDTLQQQAMATDGLDKTLYDQKQQELKEMAASVNPAEVEIHKEEAHIAILDHHAEALRLWAAFHAARGRFDSGLDHLLERQRTWNSNLVQQLPSLSESLTLFHAVAPKKGDFLSTYIKSPTLAATLVVDDFYTEDFLKKFLVALESRLKTSKDELGKREETVFDLNSSKSTASTEVSKLTTECERVEKALKSKKESFLKKIKAVKGIDYAVISSIEDFFSRSAEELNQSSDSLLMIESDSKKNIAYDVDADEEVEIVLTQNSSSSVKLAPTSSAGSLPEPKVPEDSVIFESVMTAAYDALRRSETQIAMLKSSRDTYASLQAKTRKSGACAFCTRHFRSIDEEEALNKNLDRLVDLIPSQLKDAEADQKQADSNIASLKTLEPSWNDICQLYARVPDIQKRISAARSELLVLTGSLSKARDEVEDYQAIFKSQSAVVNTVMFMIKEATDAQNVTRQIDELSAKRSSVFEPTCYAPDILEIIHSTSSYAKDSTDSLLPSKLDADILNCLQYDTLASTSADYIESMAQHVYELQQTHKSRLTEARAVQASNEVSRRELEAFVKDYQDKYMERTKAHSELVASEEAKTRAEEELNQVTAELKSVQREVAHHASELDRLKAEKSEVVARRDEHNAAYEQQSAKYHDDLAALSASNSKVISLEEKLAATSASEYETEMERLKEKLEDVRKQASETDVQLALLKNHNDSSRKRALDDAIQYQEIILEMKNAQEQIEAHRELTNDVTPEELERKVAELDKAIKHKSHQRSTQLGMMESLRRDVVSKRNDLQKAVGIAATSLNGQPLNVVDDIETEWQELVVRLETTKLASEDLAVSIDALDNALMKYHATKMNDINHILKELWENTYQGNDIDYVKIAMEAEEEGSSTSASGRYRKNYNYRVVMVKGGVDLDMRGRCSAGQRVLACLMIRMALAETFCLKCGILALDEPTSNLDQANVESLAESLRRVIEVRQKQSNFQIIVITHDEEFVKIIGRNSWTDDYYKVKKNTEQNTVIVKKSIRELK